MENKNKAAELRSLIQGSASFTEADKKRLIAKIPELSEQEQDKAIQALEEELAEWKALYARNEENKQWMRNHLQESQQEIMQMARQRSKKEEKSSMQDDAKQADSLIENL